VSGAVQPDAWLSEVMSRPAFRVAATTADGLEALVREHAARQAAAFYYTKVPAASVAVVRALHAAGFYTVDVNVTLELARAPQGLSETAVTVRPFEPPDLDPVLEVAATAFRFARFQLDPLVPAEVSARIKREWARNACLGKRGDRVFVGVLDGAPVGFLAALLVDGGRTAVIDLVGVSDRHQGRHVGGALVAAFVAQYRASCSSLLVGTQVANIPSLRLYQRMGFVVARSEYVLHKHVGA
jgi:dTDP-4-amino-4,6-dideoxy-D-galactose acyltransferase